MIYTSNQILDRAAIILVDEGATAWTRTELQGWLDDARSYAYELRPDLFELEADFTCVDGARQTLPDSSKRLFAVLYNVSHKAKRQITIVGEELLARHRPSWRSGKKVTEIEHYLYDEATGAFFETYPPAAAGVVVRLSYAKPPAKITDFDAQLDKEGETALAYVDYVLHRAFQKEAISNPNAVARSQMHLGACMGILQGTAQTKLALSPNMQRDGGKPPAVTASGG